jgi:hypothetical protein
MTLVPALALRGSRSMIVVRVRVSAPAAHAHAGVAAVRSTAGRMLMFGAVFVMLVTAHILTAAFRRT